MLMFNSSLSELNDKYEGESVLLRCKTPNGKFYIVQGYFGYDEDNGGRIYYDDLRFEPITNDNYGKVVGFALIPKCE